MSETKYLYDIGYKTTKKEIKNEINSTNDKKINWR